MTLPSNRLPPLNSLKAFDAVARLGRVSKAADELNISASSISTHIQKLETYLGIKLFKRTVNTVTLTETGLSYAREIRQAFDIIATTSSRFQEDNLHLPLRISCVPSLENSWFLDQLSAIKKMYPDLKVDCDFSPVPVNFDQQSIDIAIRYGAGQYDDADSTLLFKDKIAPVCSVETAHHISSSINTDNMIEKIECSEIAPNEISQWDYWLDKTNLAQHPKQISDANSLILKSSKFALLEHG